MLKEWNDIYKRQSYNSVTFTSYNGGRVAPLNIKDDRNPSGSVLNMITPFPPFLMPYLSSSFSIFLHHFPRLVKL